MEKFNEKIYEDGITWLFGHHCLECGHLTFAQYEVKELAKYFYELGYHQTEKDNELTWEDMFTIFHLINEVLDDDLMEGKTKKEVGEEVLRRFNNQRRK